MMKEILTFGTMEMIMTDVVTMAGEVEEDSTQIIDDAKMAVLIDVDLDPGLLMKVVMTAEDTIIDVIPVKEVIIDGTSGTNVEVTTDPTFFILFLSNKFS